jgi:hypothetical protein
MVNYRLLSLAIVLVAGLAATSLAGGAQASSESGRARQAAPALNEPNRADCAAIRGTEYWSDEERAWFLAYCIGQAVFLPPVAISAPAQPLPPVTSRPQAPAVSVTCYSSHGYATAEGDLQNVPLNAFAGEPIQCSASVFGSYTSIDWAGGFVNGSGSSFVTSFGYRTLPWTIRVQVNWGGNPVIKYISVTTVSGFAGCANYAYGVCIVR